LRQAHLSSQAPNGTRQVLSAQRLQQQTAQQQYPQKKQQHVTHSSEAEVVTGTLHCRCFCICWRSSGLQICTVRTCSCCYTCICQAANPASILLLLPPPRPLLLLLLPLLPPQLLLI
jgi:hypothetical protein